MSEVWRAVSLSVREPYPAHSRLDWWFFRKCNFSTMLVRWKQKSAIDRVLGGGRPAVEVRQSCWRGRGELEGFLGPLRADEEGSGGRQPPLLSLSLSLPLYSLLPQGFRVCIVVLLMRTVGAEHSGWRSEKQLTLGMLCSHTQNTH